MKWAAGPIVILVFHTLNAIAAVLGSIWIHRNALRGDIRSRFPTLLISVNAMLGSYSLWVVLGLVIPSFPAALVSMLSFLTLGMLGWIQALRIAHYIFQVEIKSKLMDYYEETYALKFGASNQLTQLNVRQDASSMASSTSCGVQTSTGSDPNADTSSDTNGFVLTREGERSGRRLTDVSSAPDKHTQSHAASSSVTITLPTVLEAGNSQITGDAGENISSTIEIDAHLLKQYSSGLLFRGKGAWFIEHRNLISPNNIRFHFFIATFISVATTLLAWACGAHRGDLDYSSYVFVVSWLLVLSVIGLVSLILVYCRKIPHRLARSTVTPHDSRLGISSSLGSQTVASANIWRSDLLIGSIINTIGYSLNLALFVHLSTIKPPNELELDGLYYKGGPVVRCDTSPSRLGSIASTTLATALITLIANVASYSLGTVYIMLEPYIRSFAVRHCLTRQARELKLRKFIARRESAPSLSEILADPDGYWAFRSFLESEFRAEELFFWRAAISFRSRFHASTDGPQETVDEARHIYMAYLAPEAPYKLEMIPQHVSQCIRDTLIQCATRLRTAPNVYTMAKGPHGAMRGVQCTYSAKVHAFNQLAASAKNNMRDNASRFMLSSGAQNRPLSNEGPYSARSLPRSNERTVNVNGLSSPMRVNYSADNQDLDFQRSANKRCIVTTSTCSSSPAPLEEVVTEPNEILHISYSSGSQERYSGEAMSEVVEAKESFEQNEVSSQPLEKDECADHLQRFVLIHGLNEDSGEEQDSESTHMQISRVTSPMQWNLNTPKRRLTIAGPGLLTLSYSTPESLNMRQAKQDLLKSAQKVQERFAEEEAQVFKASEVWRNELNQRQTEYSSVMGISESPFQTPIRRFKRCVYCEAHHRNILKKRMSNAKDMLLMTYRLRERLALRQELIREQLSEVESSSLLLQGNDLSDQQNTRRPVLFEIRPQVRRDIELSLAADTRGGIHIIVRIGDIPLSSPVRKKQSWVGAYASPVLALEPSNAKPKSPKSPIAALSPEIINSLAITATPFLSLPMPHSRQDEDTSLSGSCIHVEHGNKRPFVTNTFPLSPSQQAFILQVENSGQLVLAFDDAIAVVFNHLETDTYPRFLQSYYWRSL